MQQKGRTIGEVPVMKTESYSPISPDADTFQLGSDVLSGTYFKNMFSCYPVKNKVIRGSKEYYPSEKKYSTCFLLLSDFYHLPEELHRRLPG